ncbi:Hypothetical Protein NTJ_12192 [Nesidiocoris tenuis]|nr:Hypothetical Protein NTJ_12192 [Nesidiocoris tenuis]
MTAGPLLAGWILRTRTCRGISGRTQTIIFMAHLAKFVYFVGENVHYSPYAISVASVMALESIIIMYLIYVKFKKTVEKAYDTFWIEVIIIISGALAIVYNHDATDPLDVFYAGSYYLESVSILPQMYFNFRTGSKNLGVSLFVLLCSVEKSFHLNFAVKTKEYYTSASLYASYVQLGTYALYFALLIAIPKYKEEKLLIDLDSYSASLDGLSFDSEKQPPVIIVTRPILERQQSRLEMPFLKKTVTSVSLSAFAAANGSNSSSKINTPAILKKPSKLKNVSSTPNFRTENSDVPLERTHSASSISLGRESLADSQDGGITFKIKETAREGRQRRMAYGRQTSLPERESSQADAGKREEPEDSLAGKHTAGKAKLIDDETESCEESIPHFLDAVEDQTKRQRPLQANGGIQANDLESTTKTTDPSSERPASPCLHHSSAGGGDVHFPQESSPGAHKVQDDKELHTILKANDLDSARKNSDPNPIRPSCSNVEKKRRKRTISTSPDYQRKNRRATMHHPAGSAQQHGWKVLASTFIGTNEHPSSPVHQPDVLSKPDSSCEQFSPSFSAKKKRRATIQDLNMQHHSSWKTLASGLIGTSPHSPMSARFSAASPEIRRASSLARSNSDSKYGVEKQRRATVQLSPGAAPVRKRSNWQKLTDGFSWTSPAAGRRLSSPINRFRDQRSKEGGRNSRDHSGDVIEEDAEC